MQCLFALSRGEVSRACGCLASPLASVHFYTMLTAAHIYAILEARREELGLTQAEVGLRAFGKADNSAFQHLRRGSTPSAERLASLSRALDLELYFGPPRDLGSMPVIKADADGFAHVPVYAAVVGAGPGRANSNEEIVDHLAFRRDWLSRIGVAPTDAVVARVAGDSMAPLISSGDVVLIDTSRADPPARRRGPKDRRPAPIYAVLDDGEARVKRLEFVGDDALALLSDNPATPLDVRPLDRVSIIGRVLWWGHTNRE